MPTGAPVDQAAVAAAFGRLEQALGANPKAFLPVGGDVAFFVPGANPPTWHLTSLAGAVCIRPGTPPFPVLTIGITPQALGWLVEGTLDVPKAFRLKRLAIEGDPAALAALVRCFAEQVPAEAPGL